MGFFKKALSAVSGPAGLALPFVGPTQAAIQGGKALGGVLGGDVPQANIPGMSPEETAILRQQQDLLKRFTPIFGDFAADVISGKVPVSPQLEQELAQRESSIREDIARRGGSSGSALSTAGIQRLGQFQTGAAIAREQARRSLIPAAFQGINTLSGLASSALSPLQRQREMQTELALQQQQQDAQKSGFLGSLLGGAGSGALLGMMVPGVGPLVGAGLGALGSGGAIPSLGGIQKQKTAGTLQLQAPQTSIFPQRQPRYTLLNK